MADVLDLEVNQDDQMGIEEDAAATAVLAPKSRKKKGRGFVNEKSRQVYKEYDVVPFSAGDADTLAQRSVEGWILIVTGIHEEAHEDDVSSKFCDYGEIKNIHLNLDRRTGFLKGYALIEYESYMEAQAAKKNIHNTELLGQRIKVDWAFMKVPIKKRKA